MAMRNPYVALGIPFGSSRDIAQAAFARRAKKLRRAPNGTELLTELTWALNQIDEVLREPEQAVGVYRVPANPAALVPTDYGLLNPAPLLLESRYSTEQIAESEVELRTAVAAEALRVIARELSNVTALPER